ATGSPIINACWSGGFGEAWKPRLMRKRLRHGRSFFACGAVFWPIAYDRRVVVDQAAFNGHGDGDSDDPLRRRVDVDDCIPRPRARARGIAPTAPQVHNALAALINGDSSANFAQRLLAFEIGDELIAHGLEACCDFAFDSEFAQRHPLCSFTQP